MRAGKKLFKIRGGKTLLLLAGGGAASLVFPPFHGYWFGIIALVFFLVFLLKEKRSKTALFKSAYAFGFGFYATGFCWINNALLIDGDKFIGFVPVVFVATGLFFGLFWALPSLCMAWGRTIYARALFFCVAFVAMEWVRSFIFTGFPWNLLGTSLSFDVRLIQGAADIGTYGLSFVLLVLLCGVAMLGLAGYQRRFDKKAAVFVVAPLLFLAAEAVRFQPVTAVDGLKVRLVQPSIPQTFKWHPAMLSQNFRQYIDLSKVEALDDVDIVVWGEAATPYQLDDNEEAMAQITEAVPDNGFLITGLLRAGMVHGKIVPFNSMFVINKQGEIKDYYDKSHLVPFGEYLPYRAYLPEFVEPIANVVGDLGQGEKYKNLKVDGLPLMGGSICYESIFPKEVLNPHQKPEMLVVLANDGWYGISSGPYQHLAAAQMRAVEEGISVIRSANTGISALIAANGEILAQIGLNQVGFVDGRLPKQLSKNTPYGKYGNWLVWLLLVVALFGGIKVNHS